MHTLGKIFAVSHKKAITRYLFTILSVCLLEDSNQMYGSLTGLSNTGLKRGRGRGSRKKVDLNRGQHLGEGKNSLELMASSNTLK